LKGASTVNRATCKRGPWHEPVISDAAISGHQHCPKAVAHPFRQQLIFPTRQGEADNTSSASYDEI
jgi:hypothetical protein